MGRKKKCEHCWVESDPHYYYRGDIVLIYKDMGGNEKTIKTKDIIFIKFVCNLCGKKHYSPLHISSVIKGYPNRRVSKVLSSSIRNLRRISRKRAEEQGKIKVLFS